MTHFNWIRKPGRLTSSSRPRVLRSRLAVERLETRLTPAGAITAKQVGRLLILTGDDAANQVQIGNQNDNTLDSDVTVTGLSSTTIDGQSSKVFHKVASLKVVLKGGEDKIVSDPNMEFEFWGSVSLDLGDGNNTVSISPSGRLFADGFRVNAGTGNNTISVTGHGTDPNVSSVDLINMILGDGNNVVDLNQFGSLGAARINFGNGDQSIGFADVNLLKNGTTTDAPEAVRVKSGTGSVELELEGAYHVGAVNVNGRGDAHMMLGDPAIDSVSLIAGTSGTARLETFGQTATIKGKVTVRGKQATIDANGDTISFGDVLVSGGSGAAVNNFDGAMSTGAMTIQSRSGEASLTGSAVSTTIGKALSVTAAQATHVYLQATDEVKGAITIKGGPAVDEFFVGPTFKADKSVTLALGAGTNTVNISGPSIGGNLSITTGADADNITLDRVTVAGTTTIRTGAGDDHLNILSGVTFTKATTIDLGAGTDTLAVGGNGTPGAGAVTFNGKLNARLGAGNDTLLLGVTGGGADGNVVFNATGNRIDAGTGSNQFDPQAGQFDSTKVTMNLFTDPTP